MNGIKTEQELLQKGPWFKMRVAGERTQRKDSIFVGRRDFDLQVLENKLFFNK